MFFGLVVGVLGGCATTFWFVFLLLFCFLFVFWFAPSCGCGVNDVAADAGAMLRKLWVRLFSILGWYTLLKVVCWRAIFSIAPLYKETPRENATKQNSLSFGLLVAFWFVFLWLLWLCKLPQVLLHQIESLERTIGIIVGKHAP